MIPRHYGRRELTTAAQDGSSTAGSILPSGRRRIPLTEILGHDLDTPRVILRTLDAVSPDPSLAIPTRLVRTYSRRKPDHSALHARELQDGWHATLAPRASLQPSPDRLIWRSWEAVPRHPPQWTRDQQFMLEIGGSSDDVTTDWVQDNFPTLPPLWKTQSGWISATDRTDDNAALPKLLTWLKSGAISHVLFNMDFPGERRYRRTSTPGRPDAPM